MKTMSGEGERAGQVNSYFDGKDEVAEVEVEFVFTF